MQTVIYAGLRNPERDVAIFEALQSKHVREVAFQFSLASSTIRKAAKRIENARVYELTLVGGGSPLRIGQFAADGFERAALGAYRHYHGTFRNLDLPCWKITDGTKEIELMDLRAIDLGEKPLA